jgi:hypothetical protein
VTQTEEQMAKAQAEEKNERPEMFSRRSPNMVFRGDPSPEKAKTGIQWLPFWESKRKF